MGKDQYCVVLQVAAESDAAARLLSGAIEGLTNSQVCAARVTDVQRAEVSWSSILGCEMCGSLVCPGPQSHRPPAPEGGEVGLFAVGSISDPPWSAPADAEADGQ